MSDKSEAKDMPRVTGPQRSSRTEVSNIMSPEQQIQKQQEHQHHSH